ncbi:succinate-semialdehyde dehydrogenase (NADP(+)) [Porphyrobacter sp. TH134]|uniref:NAD-dependent succinate-semialdehyde dehydrogenase n=1 Tax=Porphyrobacter sp. TH134 TaxID=2067450 RepID=UPI000C7D4188|nr:NAD-dependent succinate-semialdehyde dehydrogenase [Porphyrobacter sp. TH134]PLK22808.1 succinate-semialdehyde dehydrogenase (NADP(+)) [Porphyrobacter sp. TH134]
MTCWKDLLSPYLMGTGGLAVRDPANGELVAAVADHGPREVEAAIAAAEAAQPEWAERPAKARAAILRDWHDLILAHAEALAQLATLESGKPLAESRGEVGYAASFIEWFAEQAKRVNGEILPSPWPGKRVLVHKQPVGVTAAITPWNFPLAMITRKAGPALGAGCAMLVKPAEATPLSALALERLAHRAGVPEAVFRVLPSSAAAAVGSVLCASPVIRKLSFTGSTAVGKVLMQQAAATVTRLSLELGGSAPFIVFEDADIDAAVAGALASKYRNAGQTCVCANRFLVHHAAERAFVDRLAAAVNAMTMGHGLAPGTQIGPLIDRRAVENVHALVADALAAGATLAAGREWQADDGSFHPPVVLTGVTPHMRIAREEIFGPVAAIIRFADEAEAVAIANDTPYGLAAYVYTRDPARTWRLMDRLECGMIGFNEGIISTEIAPFGGIKESGLGREGSHHGIEEYLEMKYCLLGGMER